MSSKITGETSDGFHTFNELYAFREALTAALFNMWAAIPSNPYGVHKSRRHSDGEECFGGGWFIVMATLPVGQVSFHYPDKDWNDFAVPEMRRADTWDGHDARQALTRLQTFNKVYPAR